MQINEQPYRSEGRGVNQEDDMVRVTLDLPIRQWRSLGIRESLMAEAKKTKAVPFVAPCKLCGEVPRIFEHTNAGFKDECFIVDHPRNECLLSDRRFAGKQWNEKMYIQEDQNGKS